MSRFFSGMNSSRPLMPPVSHGRGTGRVGQDSRPTDRAMATRENLLDAAQAKGDVRVDVSQHVAHPRPRWPGQSALALATSRQVHGALQLPAGLSPVSQTELGPPLCPTPANQTLTAVRIAGNLTDMIRYPTHGPFQHS